MNYYIATKLENHAEHNKLRDKLAAIGWNITYDWTTHGSVKNVSLERLKEVAELEINGVLDSDLIIVLWPGGRGTHVEMGAALGDEIPVFFVSPVENHHTTSTETSAFYHHPLVKRFKDVEEFLLYIGGWAGK